MQVEPLAPDHGLRDQHPGKAVRSIEGELHQASRRGRCPSVHQAGELADLSRIAADVPVDLADGVDARSTAVITRSAEGSGQEGAVAAASSEKILPAALAEKLRAIGFQLFRGRFRSPFATDRPDLHSAHL